MAAMTAGRPLARATQGSVETPFVLPKARYDLRVTARLDDHLSWATAGS
jgi:hypothetical protein